MARTAAMVHGTLLPFFFVFFFLFVFLGASLWYGFWKGVWNGDGDSGRGKWTTSWQLRVWDVSVESTRVGSDNNGDGLDLCIGKVWG